MSSNNQITTYFDSPLRSTETEIENHKIALNKNASVEKLFQALPNAAVLLDSNRQIVTFNKRAQSILNPDENNNIEGRRVGEAINCIHAFDMPAGCGTSKFCEECGAGKCNKYTRESLDSCSNECRITIKKDNIESSLDLKVHSSILELDEYPYTFFIIEDIKDEKRRKVLENVFFHDVLNTATAIQGISEILNTTDKLDEINEFSGLLLNSSHQLISEIQSQRDLQNAEQGSLVISVQSKSANEIISRAYDIYKNTKLSKDKKYICKYLDNDIHLNTDSVLLIRSLGNLIKNALEASDKFEQIKVYCDIGNDYILFNVQNDKVIPEQVQLQLFQRSFSTKASNGRGIGTYSVKLFVEQYLKGVVSFVSNNKIGTIFTIKLPLY